MSKGYHYIVIFECRLHSSGNQRWIFKKESGKKKIEILFCCVHFTNKTIICIVRAVQNTEHYTKYKIYKGNLLHLQLPPEGWNAELQNIFLPIKKWNENVSFTKKDYKQKTWIFLELIYAGRSRFTHLSSLQGVRLLYSLQHFHFSLAV